MKIKHLFIGIALTANLFAATAQEVKKTYFVSKPGTLISMMTEEEANQVLDQLMESYLQKHTPENPSSTMEMWKIREQAKMQAEEVVLHQVVMTFH